MATARNAQTEAIARRDQLEEAKTAIFKELNKPAALAAFKTAWPNGEVDPQQVATQVFSVVSRRPDLLECEPKSLLATTVEGLLLGLSFLPHLKQAHIVPFKDKGVKKAQLIVGYMGMVKAARNTGLLSHIDAHVVYEKDHFDFELGMEPRLSHKPPKSGDRGKKVGVYAVAKLTTGDTVFRYLSREEVEFYKSRSASADSGPWVSDEDAQWRKTAIRRLVGYLPMDEKLARMVHADEMAETGNSQPLAPEFFNDVIDVQPIEDEKPVKSKTEERKEALKKQAEQKASTKPEPEPEPEPEDDENVDPQPEKTEADYERETVHKHVTNSLKLLYKSKADADIAVSEATGGKYQSVDSLDKAPVDVLRQVHEHLKNLTAEDLGQ